MLFNSKAYFLKVQHETRKIKLEVEPKVNKGDVNYAWINTLLEKNSLRKKAQEEYIIEKEKAEMKKYPFKPKIRKVPDSLGAKKMVVS